MCKWTKGRVDFIHGCVVKSVFSSAADPCLWLMDPDLEPAPDPAIFVTDIQDTNKNLLFSKFLCLILFEVTFT
jgi:hypothetical protein